MDHKKIRDLVSEAYNREKNERPLTQRGHSYRNYTPKEFIEYSLDEEGKLDDEKQTEARMVLRRMEGGRFHPMLDKISLMFSHLDPDEKKMFASRNPGIMRWVGVFGFLEDLNTFENYTNVPSSFDFRD